jgi:PilZ domain
MQQLSHVGNARREERVLLPALIELRSEYGEDTLTADGLDVSPSGLAVRAAFVPEVGTRLYCHFRCPPRDDAVHALGEVVWSVWDEPLAGSFGLRFLELDTKSATAIRRYLEADPRELREPAHSRGAVMRIDGLDAPIEADVKLLEKGCIILEQELSFLRLGRGIEVDVPGRDKRHGRIASIELRQGPCDTPTLVFGVLFDETRPGVVAEAVRALDARASRPAAPPGPLPGDEYEALDGMRESSHASAPRQSHARAADEPRVVRHAEHAGSDPARGPDESDEELEALLLQNRLPEALLQFVATLKGLPARVRGELMPALRERLARSWRRLAALADPAWAEPLRTQLKRVRLLLGAQWSRLVRRRAHGRRRSTSPGLRVQKTLPPMRMQRAEPPPPRRVGRPVTVTLALVGVGLGVYALAPRSGADRIRLRPRAAQSVENDATGSEPASATPKLAPGAQPAAQVAPPKPSAAAQPAPTPEPAAVRFGDADVPNGRSFVLRMSGPVLALEGERREDGFSVRVHGRLALDRASPIATSHRGVARALILNRGEYAELTVEFLPGMHPKYQVLGKGSAIEVVLERP